MASENDDEEAAAVDSTEDAKQDDTPAGEANAAGEPEVRRLSVAPTLKRRSSSSLSAVADFDLAELSLLDVLTQAATDVLNSIPAQRCIVFIYDKAANLLRPQVVVDCNEKEEVEATENKPTESSHEVLATLSEKAADSSTADIVSEEVVTSPLVSFPPVVGMVSSCFLQRRCLRMQEPNPHRAFHREYDVPKDMQVNSILCAPVILYRRATAVIQLLNRLNTTADRSPFEETERAATPQDARSEATNEVRLRRLKTIKAIVKTGFSTKDEQKLLHFTTHIAQTIEINTKKLANGRSHAKLREDKAKQALDLLNALNGNIVARVNSTEMLVPTTVTEHTGRVIYMRRATITRLPSHSGVLTDMLSALVIIMRLQAMFRGRRQRRADKFAEELEKFRKQRERMRTVIVMQRMNHTPEETKSRVYEKPVASQVSRAKETPSRSPRIRVDEPQRPPQPPTGTPPTTLSSKPLPRTQPVEPLELPLTRQPTEPSRIQKRRMSARKIQTVFRRQRRPTPAPHIPTSAKPDEGLSEEIAWAVKVQAFVRGNLARKRLRRALLSRQGPHIICLRVASTSTVVDSNQTSHESPRSTRLRSQTCVYAMPPSKAPQMHSPAFRHVQEEFCNAAHSEGKAQGVAVVSRRLVAIHHGDDNFRSAKSPTRRPRPRWDRLVSPVVWEATQQPGLEIAPPGVEFVKQRQPNASSEAQRTDKASSPRYAAMTGFLEAGKAAALDKASVRLPTLSSRTLQDPATSSLLCCLLPAQSKRLVGGSALLAVRPLDQLRRRAHKAKRRQSPSKASV